MRASLRTLVFVAGLATVGCSAAMEVRTISAPDAQLSRIHSFRILPGPARRDGRPATGEDDPMVTNSIANRAIRDRIQRAMMDRGYVLDERNPDVNVAFYASAREKLDITNWNYGYPANPGWWHYGPPPQRVTQYTEGSVVIDLVEPHSGELIWRGEGTAELSDDLMENLRRLSDMAAKVVEKLPQQRPATVAMAARRTGR